MISHGAYLQVALLLFVLPASASAGTTIPCTIPSIRREWRSLSRAERMDWIRSVKCLAQLPHSPSLKPTVNPDIGAPVNASSSFYDDLVYMHMDTGRLLLHDGYMFPWHRWYLHGFENALKTKCGYQGTTPYWDWRKDASDAFSSPIFDPDPEIGLGTSGDTNNDIEVQDGAFGAHSTFRVSYPYPHPLRRNFTLQPWKNVQPPVAQFYSDPTRYANSSLTYSVIESIVNGHIGDYKGFTVALEGYEGPLYSVHGLIGGDIGGHPCPSYAPSTCDDAPRLIPNGEHGGPAPNDPIFWLHHGMIDKIWADWQSKNSQNLYAFDAGSVAATDNVTYFNEWPSGAPPMLTLNDTMPNENMFPAVKIGDVFNIKGDVLCYEYK